MTDQNKKRERDEADRMIMEIGYMGALSGLLPLAGDIFAFYADQDYGGEAAEMGRAVSCLCRRDDDGAARILENLLGRNEDCAEAKALLALAYQRQKKRGDRAAALMKELEILPDGNPARSLAAQIGRF